MNLSNEQLVYLESRRKKIRYWPIAGLCISLGLTGLAVWLFVFHPLLINPFLVFRELEAKSIPDSTVALLAAIAPVMTLFSLFLVGIMLVFSYSWMRNERRYQEIIVALEGNNDG